MKSIKFNISIIGLWALFFVVSIEAADKTELKKNKDASNEKQNSALAAETVPPGYVAPTQPAKGIKFTAPIETGNNSGLAFIKKPESHPTMVYYLKERMTAP